MREKKRKNEEFIKGDINVAILKIICKGRIWIGRPEPESTDTSLKALTRHFEELLWQRTNTILALFPD